MVLIKVHVLTIIFLQFSRSLIVAQGQPKNIMAEMAGDGSVDRAVAFDQEHSELVLNVDWWWAVHICLCAIAVVANLIFIITVIHNRYETFSDFYFVQLVQQLNLRHLYVNWELRKMKDGKNNTMIRPLVYGHIRQAIAKL